MGGKERGHIYDDIIDLPYQKSQGHPAMPVADRAAQFSPFAALVGLDATMEETARRTEERIELEEEAKELLDRKWQEILSDTQGASAVRIRFFQADERKSGGAYVTVEGTIRKIEEYGRTITLSGGEVIPLSDVVEIDRLEK